MSDLKKYTKYRCTTDGCGLSSLWTGAMAAARPSDGTCLACGEPMTEVVDDGHTYRVTWEQPDPWLGEWHTTTADHTDRHAAEAQYRTLAEWERTGQEPVRAVTITRSETRFTPWDPAAGIGQGQAARSDRPVQMFDAATGERKAYTPREAAALIICLQAELCEAQHPDDADDPYDSKGNLDVDSLDGIMRMARDLECYAEHVEAHLLPRREDPHPFTPFDDYPEECEVCGCEPADDRHLQDLAS